MNWNWKRKFACVTVFVLYTLYGVLYFKVGGPSLYMGLLPLQKQTFTSPFVVDENEHDPWKTAEIWRKRLVDQTSSTAWLPIVKDLGQTDGAAAGYDDTASTSNGTTATTSTSNGTPAKSSKHDTINIALYNRPFWLPLSSFSIFSKCAYNNCRYIGAQNTRDVDALVVYGDGLDLGKKVPRWPYQVFVMMSLESPVHSGGLPVGGEDWWNWAFNMTMSYRLSSDVFLPYGFLKHEPKPAHELPNYMVQAKGKTKMVAWLVSNCYTPSGREQYVQELQKHIQVDIYGACLQPCNTSSEYFCEDILQYRFYLVFENSICVDYVTEKYFKLFGKRIVPVVRGGVDFKRLFPPYTFINAMDFASPKQLAQELIRLSTDLKEYTRYLKTMDEYRKVDTHKDFSLCQLCKKLNMVDYSKSTFYDIHAWLGLSSHCRLEYPNHRTRTPVTVV